jgi:hypothetical protein
MLDTFVAYAPGGKSTDADGMEATGYVAQGVTRGKIQGGSAATADVGVVEVTVGGVKRPLVRGGLHIPADAPAPVHGDLGRAWEYELTALGPSTPADLLGSRWLVVSSEPKSTMTARRMDVVRLR